jgi:hypothetical protein
MSKSKFKKPNLNNKGLYHSQEFLAMGNGGVKVEKDTNMENVSKPLGKSLLKVKTH